MALTIKNNMGAVRSLNRLEKNDKNLSKNLRKLSTGLNLVSAEDDASAYSIGRRMQIRLRSLSQDEVNAQNAQSMLQIATGAIQRIIEDLRAVKGLAIEAANDYSPSDDDRKTIEKEMRQRLEAINDLAANSEFNGQKLLDGSKSVKTRTETIIPPSPPSEEVEATDGDTLVIDKDGVYNLRADNANGKTVEITAQNVRIRTNGKELEQVKIVVSANNADLCIEEVHITNSEGSVIEFTGSGDHTLTILGNNKLETTDDSEAAVKIGSDSRSLNVCGGEGSNLEVSAGLYGAAIGSSYKDSGNSTELNINTFGSITANAKRGAAIGSGESGSIGTINIFNGNITASTVRGGGSTGGGAAIGSGRQGTINGSIVISGGNVTATGVKGAGIGGGYNSNDTGVSNIIISDGYVNATSSEGAAIGTGRGGVFAGSIEIDGGTVYAETVTFDSSNQGDGAGIGSGVSSKLIGSIIINGGEVIYARYNSGGKFALRN